MKKFILFLSLIIISTGTFAQEKTKKVKTEVRPSVAFAPDNINKEVSPGETVLQKLVIQNISGVDVEVELTVDELETNEAGTVILKNHKSRYKGVKTIKHAYLKDGITIPEKIIKLKANEKKVVNFSIKVPEKAIGSYYFVYSVKPLPSFYGKLKKNMKNAALGLLVNLNGVGVLSVKEKELHQLSIDAKVDYKKTLKKVMINSNIENKGNGFLKEMAGFVTIMKDNQIISKIDLVQGNEYKSFLPKTKKSFVGTLDMELQKGDYTAILTIQDKKQKIVETKTLKFKVN